MSSFLSVGPYVYFTIRFVTFVPLKIETLNLIQVGILVCITTGMSFIILTKPVLRWRPFKTFDVEYYKNQ
jgi:hypothetical protein